MIHNDSHDGAPARPGLEGLGWDARFQHILDIQDSTGTLPARVVSVRRNSFLIHDGAAETIATASGTLRGGGGGDFPATGDWVLLRDSVITATLPRKNALSRGASGARGKTEGPAMRKQVIAANLDTVLIVCGLDRDFNLRRIERYLTLVYNCGVAPAVVLTKADLHPDPDGCAAQVEGVAFGVPVHLVGLGDESGPRSLEHYLAPGQTAAMIGSSGAGKSTLLNRLAGSEVQTTGAVSETLGKGKHTTTSRDLIILPSGGMLIDNPGIREVALWDDGDGLDGAFPDIETLAQECRFADCGHATEPGCRVLQAVETGELAPDRLESYRKMRRELDYQNERSGKSADRVEKERWQWVAKRIKAMKKGNRHG